MYNTTPELILLVYTPLPLGTLIPPESKPSKLTLDA